MRKPVHYVIGSGPAGVATAAALIANGRDVTLLDAGVSAGAENQLLRSRMAQREPEEWTLEERQASRAKLASDELASKLSFGSDHPYRPIPEEIDIDYGGLEVRGSFAKGGLSDVWGAAVLPFVASDTERWPIKAEELRDAHAAVVQMLHVAGKRDALAKLFPLPVYQDEGPRQCMQVQRLMSSLQRNQEKLEQRGVLFGSSRLAVNFSGARDNGAGECNYCGHCLHGCPRDLIYSSRHTLEQLTATGKLRYVPGVIVKTIEERGKKVTIDAVIRGGSVAFEADRAFLAAGVFNTTAILLRSFGWYDKCVEIADSQYYVLPLLQFSAVSNVDRERLHTLAQVFLEIRNAEISEHLVHLQIYGFNDLLVDAMKHTLGRLWGFMPKNQILGRLLLVQGYLHSDHSGSIRARLTRRSNGDVLRLTGVENPETRSRVRRVVDELRAMSLLLRAVPVRSLLRILQPGRGFHCGGSFPMAAHPQSGQTDVLGRPLGWERVHVVDASVFPSIPATTITQTVMANAYRIASQTAQANPRGFS